jgi:hypothetical protein
MIYNAPIKDMLFLINEWLGLDRVTALPGYEEFDADLLEAILEEAGKFASTELLTINREGDEHGVTIEDGEVRTPPGFRVCLNSCKTLSTKWSVRQMCRSSCTRS